MALSWRPTTNTRPPAGGKQLRWRCCGCLFVRLLRGSGTSKRPEAVLRALQFAHRLLKPDETRGLGRLLRFEVLVDREEVLDLVEQRSGDVGDRSRLSPAGSGGGNGDQLGVGSMFVTHQERAQDPCLDDATRERSLFDEHECIERVAVAGERPGNVA